MIELRLGIAGLGTVAQGVLHILHTRADQIARRSGLDLVVTRVASRTPKPDVDIADAEFSTELDSLLAPDVDVVVELIGGESPAKELIEKALLQGKSVVTANKAVIARYGNQLTASNEKQTLKYEASVAGAVPIVQAISEALVGNQIDQLVGIINGTCNYILTAMQDDGTEFASALATAQELGYAEADPSFDIDGIDAAHKLTILAGLAFDTTFEFDRVYVEGITHITVQDITYAAELGYRIKHVGIAKQSSKGIEARVHPVLVPEKTLFANVSGVTNAVLVNSDAAGQTLYSGPGAGGAATASAVVADIVAAGLGASAGSRDVAPAEFVDIGDIECANYVRLPVKDEPGVFAVIAKALSDRGISIEAAIQKEPDGQSAEVSIVILTGTCDDSNMTDAIEHIAGESYMCGSVVRIRVENLD